MKQKHRSSVTTTRTPTPILKLRGSKLAKGRAATEPVYPPGMPPPPKFLSEGARREWQQITAELAGIGILSTVDRVSLTCYCQAVAMLEEASKIVATDGIVAVSSKGLPYPNPATAVTFAAMKELHHWLAEFGLTPASRSLVRLNKTHENDDTPKAEEFVRFSDGGTAGDQPASAAV